MSIYAHLYSDCCRLDPCLQCGEPCDAHASRAPGYCATCGLGTAGAIEAATPDEMRAPAVRRGREAK
jgi:hypothetical protein